MAALVLAVLLFAAWQIRQHTMDRRLLRTLPDKILSDAGLTRYAVSIAKPVFGRDRVVRLLLGFARIGEELELTMRFAEVNGQAGAVFFAADGKPYSVVAVDIDDSVVTAVRSIVNPDKLGHLGPVGEIAAVLERARRNEARGPARPPG